MDMGMVGFIVECRIPFQMIRMDFQVFSQLHSFGGKQGFPRKGIVIPKPGSIFTAQGNNRRPHISGICGYLIRNLIENQRLIPGREQAVAVKLFNTGTVCNVVQILFPVADLIKMLLQCNGDKLRGILPVRIFTVILIFK